MFKNSIQSLHDQGVLLSGYQKKLKTMKKKYFVLYKGTITNSARLEYYDNEKKFKSGLAPKRVIKLKNCFNINRRLDTKYDYVIALSTKESGFGIVLDTEQEMLIWLEQLIALQRNDIEPSGTNCPQYDHVWQVKIRKQGIAEEKGLIGNYFVCLTIKSVTLMRIGNEHTVFGDPRLSKVEIALTTIRRCGDTQCLFYMEVGRQSSIGPGELWMETDDNLIAQNMHSMILSAMSSRTESNIEPMRKRSSSANEASKPINVLQRRQTQADHLMSNNSPQTTKFFGRERCDSLPTRNRTSSECSNQSLSMPMAQSIRNNTSSSLHSSSLRHSSSPPMGSVTVCSESEESSLSVDDFDDTMHISNYRFNSRDGIIPEENTDDLVISEWKEVGDLKPGINDRNSLNIGQVEAYMSMTPLHLANGDSQKANAIMYSNCSLDDSKLQAVQVNCVGNMKDNRFMDESEFPELLMDSSESQIERPTRCYSIGSKVEHTNKPKFIGHMVSDPLEQAYQMQHRVRAFSVGSRAKIPRSDIQRSILNSKMPIEKNQGSQNNSLLTSQSMNKITNVDTKSISVPILIHKSYNSVDRMGDLMEIDFSKSSPVTMPCIKSHKAELSATIPKFHQLSKSVPTSNTSGSHNSDGQIPFKRDCMDSIQTTLSQLKIKKQFPSVENGYLEMKPVGLNVPGINDNTVNTKCVAADNDFSNVSENETIDMSKKVEIHNGPFCLTGITDVKAKQAICNFGVHDINCKPRHMISHHENDEVNLKVTISRKSMGDTSKPESNGKFLRNGSIKLTESNKNEYITQSSAQTDIINDDYVNIDQNISENTKIEGTHFENSNSKTKGVLRKTKPQSTPTFPYKGNILRKRASDESSKINCADGLSNMPSEAGYEILQIKSDSSLQSFKPINHRVQSQTPPLKTISNKTSTPIKTPSPISSSNYTCSQASCFNSLQEAKTLTTSDSNTQSHTNVGPDISINSLSRPASLSSEHELHYADLDLNQCNTGFDGVNTVIEPVESSKTSTNSLNCNSYAKIDFEHSDTSSTS